MKRHPSFERIYDAVCPSDGHGGDDVRRHVEECATCAESAAWIRAILAAVAEGPIPEPTTEALERAISIPETAPLPVRREATRTGWSLARLVQDAFARPAMAGVRGEPAGQRSLYKAEGAHLDLEVAVDPDDAERCRMTGQLMIEGTERIDEVLAVLWQDSRVAARAVGDDLGIFVFDEVIPGTYRLEVWSRPTGQTIRVEGLAVDVVE